MTNLADYKKSVGQSERLLRKYNITTPPVPIENIIKGEGLNVYEVDFKDHNDLVSGLIVPEKKTIYVNKYEQDNRQAFTIAHELGHWIMHKPELEKGDSELAVLYRKTGPGGNVDPKEKEANCFAANLLVPKSLLDKYPLEKYTIPELAQIFGVSEQVIAFRLANEYGNF